MVVKKLSSVGLGGDSSATAGAATKRARRAARTRARLVIDFEPGTSQSRLTRPGRRGMGSGPGGIAISGASILSSTTIADGFVIIPADSEGHAAGTTVDVFLYDN